MRVFGFLRSRSRSRTAAGAVSASCLALLPSCVTNDVVDVGPTPFVPAYPAVMASPSLAGGDVGQMAVTAGSGGAAPAPVVSRQPSGLQFQPASARGNQFPPDAPSVRASSYLLMDMNTGETIAQKNPDTQRAVASTQKLLTALVVLDRGNLDSTVTIAKSDTTAPPSKMYFKAGDRFTRRQLLQVFLVKSANDAGLALARDHSGSTSAFATAMNRKARQLGANHTRFVNPHGLTEPGQYSTARDIARIAYAAYKNPFIRQTARMQSVTVHGKTYKTTNKLLKRMPEANGLKTGYTNAAGRCLVSTARVRGRDLMLVQLGSSESVIWGDAERLLRWGAARAPLDRRGTGTLASAR